MLEARQLNITNNFRDRGKDLFVQCKTLLYFHIMPVIIIQLCALLMNNSCLNSDFYHEFLSSYNMMYWFHETMNHDFIEFIMQTECSPDGTCTLTIDKTVKEDEGEYVCQATNPEGSAATVAELVMTGTEILSSLTIFMIYIILSSIDFYLITNSQILHV